MAFFLHVCFRLCLQLASAAAAAMARLNTCSPRKYSYVIENSGQNVYDFTIPMSGCGTQSNDGIAEELTFYNTIIFQMDPLVQEIWDIARRLSCSWTTNIAKTVTFLPFSVGMLDIQELSFGGDNVECWMELLVGEGPFAAPISGIVAIGDRMTMVIYARDQDGSFDIGVRDCYAYDNPDFESVNTNSLQLTDGDGCPLKPKLMQQFLRTKSTGDSGATMLAYSYIQAFKFPDKMEIYMSCEVQICKGTCNNRCSPEVTDSSGDNPVVVLPPTQPTIGPQPAPNQPPQVSLPPLRPTPRPIPRPQPTPRPILRPQPTQRPILRPRPTPRPIIRPQPTPRPIATRPPFVQPPRPFPVPQPVPKPTGGDGTHRGQNPRYHAFHRHLYEQSFGRRIRRDVSASDATVRLSRVVLVAGKDDLVQQEGRNESPRSGFESGSICMPVISFSVGMMFLSLALVVACIVVAFLSIRLRRVDKDSQ